MKILYTAPRFHTNQVPIVKGLLERGHEVRIFVAFEGAIEDHSLLEPLVLRPSRETLRERRQLSRTKQESNIEGIVGWHFIPDYAFLKKVFLDYMPDIVICREKISLTLCVYVLCKENAIPCILYDQEPVFFKPGAVNKPAVPGRKAGLFKRLCGKAHRMLSSELRMLRRMKNTTGYPSVRLSPVKYLFTDKGEPSVHDAHSYYVPLVYEASVDLKKNNAPCGMINMLFVGKYRDYKDIPLLIAAMEKLKHRDDWRLTIVGQAKSPDEIEFEQEIQAQITRKGLAEKITLRENYSYCDMPTLYRSNDILILPSKIETYGMAIVEAMAHGLMVICSDKCGAAFCNSEAGGIVVKQGDVDSLCTAIEYGLDNPSDVRKRGLDSGLYVKKNLSFDNYYKALSILLSNEFRIVL